MVGWAVLVALLAELPGANWRAASESEALLPYLDNWAELNAFPNGVHSLFERPGKDRTSRQNYGKHF